MPRVKIDYVVSFSSEDPEHPASNLLMGEVSKKRWLCSKWEPSCSVVLQLARAIQISSVNIGAYNTAFIEVLVGRSESPNDQFEVLVARSVLQGPSEARRGEAGQRVRSFSGLQLAHGGARWDRLRLVCSQPYRKDCQFGLSFVHVYEPEAAAGQRGAAGPLRLDAGSSDDEFRPGELFRKHWSDTAAATETQIRQASSQALKNIDETSTKLKKIPINRVDREKKTPHTDKQVADPQSKPGSQKGTDDNVPLNSTTAHRKHERFSAQVTDSEKGDDTHDRKRGRDLSDGREKRGRNDDYDHGERDSKRQRPDKPNGRPGKAASDVLRGVVFSVSGYEHPQRAAVRAAGLALGARYSPRWGAHCTHLISAFPNTPKMRLAAGAPAASAQWLRAMLRAGRRLPWEPYAADSARRAPRHALGDTRSTDDDTDDEIEKVLSKQKQRECSPPDTEGTADTSRQSPADTSRQSPADTSRQSPADSDSDATLPPSPPPSPPGPRGGLPGGLPALLEGCTFVLSPRLGADRARLERYVRAYGGLLVQAEQAADCAVDYWVGGGGPAGRGVSARWLARRLDRGRRLPHGLQ